MQPPTASAPSCSLEAGDFKQRVAWIAALNDQFLLAHHRQGGSLILRYALNAEREIRELVAREGACCAFLQFDIGTSGQVLELTVGVPSDHLEKMPTCCWPPSMAWECSPMTRRAAVRADMTTQKHRTTGLTVTTASVALACGVCCVLPIALPAIALTTTGGVLAWFGSARPWFTGIAGLAVLVGWLRVWRASVKAGARPAPATLRWMAFATIVFLGALIWPWLEPVIIRLLRG